MKQDAIKHPLILNILNGIPHGVALIDSDFRLLGMNHTLEALTGYDSEDSQGAPVDHILRSNLSHRNSLFVQSLKNCEQVSLEGDLINCNRKKIQVRMTVSPVTQDSAKLSTLLVFVEDISFFRELEQGKQGIAQAKGILGHSLPMQELFEFLPVLAHTDATALITGETGTGKDLLAEAIHLASKRAKYPFIKVNCGALPESLLESELFGHTRGAFTGAHSDKPGMFRLAQGGTIFLTEIGDLPLPLQVKLLTVLDDREFYPLGSSKKTQVDIRVITGTHRNLKQLVEEGKFRQDLYFRLNVLHVHMPPLRDRTGDIRLLADHFLQQFSMGLQKEIKGFNKEALALLENYSFPGNVRELRNIIEYAVNICKSDKIQREHLPVHILSSPPGAGETYSQSTPQTSQASPAESRAGTTPSFAGGFNGDGNWKDLEKKMIMDALLQCKGNRGLAAEMLGWGRSTLWRKMKQYQMA